MAGNKTKPTWASVYDFITAIENPRRRSDSLTALKMYKDITGFPPVMWGPSIIGFGSRHYVYETGVLYAKLGKHKKSVACLYINKLDDVDLDVLREIVTPQMVEESNV